VNGQRRETRAKAALVPPGLADLVAGMTWERDLIGEAGATVHRLHAPGRATLYLKHGTGEPAEDITAEMVRQRWLGRFMRVPDVRAFHYVENQAWLLNTAIPGRTAYEALTSEPDEQIKIVSAIAEHLRALHAIPITECPFNSRHVLRLAEARRRLEAGQVVTSDFDPEHENWTPEQVWEEMTALLPIEEDLVVTHGDFTLDNILIEGFEVTGLIDLGKAGIADRYQDLAPIWSNLGEFGKRLQAHFFRAYGIEEPEIRKIRFHLDLGEFF